MLKIPRLTRRAAQVAAVTALLALVPSAGVFAATTPTATPSTVATATAKSGAPPLGLPGPFGGPPPGPRGPRGGDPLTRAQNALTQAKTDATAATGKMDLTNVQAWISDASTVLQSAQTDQTNGKTDLSRHEAGEAFELAAAADAQMSATLGTALPSMANRPTPPPPPSGTTTVSKQVRVSHMLAHTYQDIVAQRDALTKASLSSPWPDVLSQAETAYKSAYNAYQSGKYDQAAGDAGVAEHLTHAIGQAVGSTVDPTKPVTVPSPTF